MLQTGNKVKTGTRQARRRISEIYCLIMLKLAKMFYGHTCRGELKTMIGAVPLFENANDKDSMKFGDEEKAK